MIIIITGILIFLFLVGSNASTGGEYLDARMGSCIRGIKRVGGFVYGIVYTLSMLGI